MKPHKQRALAKLKGPDVAISRTRAERTYVVRIDPDAMNVPVSLRALYEVHLTHHCTVPGVLALDRINVTIETKHNQVLRAECRKCGDDFMDHPTIRYFNPISDDETQT